MKISLITVTFNSESTLSNTIESVLSQTYPDIEYIIVDGLSRDKTVEIIKEYEPRFEGRMQWISEKDKGLYDAMNKGVRMATGDVVGILNSDDFFTSEDVLEKVVQGFTDEVDAVYGDIHFVNPEDLKKCVRYYSSKVFRRGLMRLGFLPAHPSFYCRRELFGRYGVYRTDFRIAADFDLLLRYIYKHRIRTRYLPVDMVTMRTGGASTESMGSRWKGLNEQLQSLRENGVWSCKALLCLKYVYKVTELMRR